MSAKTIQTREMYLSVSRYTWVKQITPAEAPAGTEIHFDTDTPVAPCFTGKSGKASLYRRYSNSAQSTHPDFLTKLPLDLLEYIRIISSVVRK